MSSRGSVSGFVGAIPGAAYGVANMMRAGVADVVSAVDPRRLGYGKEAPSPLDLRDPDYISRTLPALRALSDVYFRGEVRGLENIPEEGPVLLVGNHSGGTLIADTFVFAQAFYDHFGPERKFHQLAHDLVFAVPGIRATLQPYGTVPASPDNMRAALAKDAALLVYPGGDHESYRASWRSSEIDFAGRKGFVRLALELGVPIVPIVAIGGQETALFLGQGHRVAQALRLDKRLRLKVAPVQLGPPFGVTFLDAPLRLPIPAKITVEVLPLIDLAEELGEDADPQTGYDFVTGVMQEKLTELAEERTLPVVG
jgi:1-acyl-sn-glycerol-3-phosphate acyltransferase